MAQELTNRAILTQVANRTKSDADADGYLRSVKTRFPKALALQCIPADEELWKIENYEEFLASRRSTLTSELNAFLDGITATEDEQNPVSIEDQIADGESDELEFKSSLRWDYKEQTVNKKLEEVIVKSIAAFANSQGGTLLIGVNDDGVTLGLEHDFTSLGGDADKFELHLRNLINQHFGVAFATNKIRCRFHAVGDKEICQIDISQSAQAAVVKLTDKSGQPAERFFVRSGNSSREVPLSEMQSYMKERFG